MAINRIILSGRLTKDPELRYTPSGTAVCTFTLASERNFKNAHGERETDFVPVVVYRQIAELAANVLAKGKKTTIDGRLQVRSFEGNDGQRHWVTEIVADIVEFPPKESGENYQQYQGNQQSQQGSPQGRYNDQSEGQNWGSNLEFSDDDIPFY